MKRICCPFITLLMVLSLLSACQPTPEVEPVAQKDSEALIEQVEVAEEGVADMAKAPETRHITRELTEVSQRTGIDITIDADVVLPETDAIPVARVAERRAGHAGHGKHLENSRQRQRDA